MGSFLDGLISWSIANRVVVLLLAVALLIFAPCEKVLIDQANNPSLIGVIQGLTSPPPPDVAA